MAAPIPLLAPGLRREEVAQLAGVSVDVLAANRLGSALFADELDCRHAKRSAGEPQPSACRTTRGLINHT
ncbi:hypothetical protein P3T36_005847 [Kitasatospora sp. MAP12-15]|uniref:hypothetical protein n=1 Tax=unclassified Kitasatospora TaxID=2633591 RepID=UPI002475519B|nr:hypothetical protein [Kitasatospora sp. MAP12-44]MDH6110121.1 hypothetical protein [Kitasatospora sp. MAP12-44]